MSVIQSNKKTVSVKYLTGDRPSQIIQIFDWASGLGGGVVAVTTTGSRIHFSNTVIPTGEESVSNLTSEKGGGGGLRGRRKYGVN